MAGISYTPDPVVRGPHPHTCCRPPASLNETKAQDTKLSPGEPVSRTEMWENRVAVGLGGRHLLSDHMCGLTFLPSRKLHVAFLKIVQMKTKIICILSV